MAFGSNYNGGFKKAESVAQTEFEKNPFADTVIGVQERIEIPEGTYPFIVKSWTPDYFDGSEKASPCNTCKLVLGIELPDGKEAELKHTIFMREETKWQVAQLFRSVGAPTDAEGNVQIKWGELESSKGAVQLVKKDKFTNVKKFLAPER